MAFRFWRRLKIAPGVTLNLSKPVCRDSGTGRSGGSLSFGPRGAKVTLGKKGVRKTVGIPGSGLFYTCLRADRSEIEIWQAGTHRQATTTSYSKSSCRKGSAESPIPTVPPEDRLTLGFFKRLFTPDDLPAPQSGKYYIYVLRCRDGSFYIGQTDNIPRRLEDHYKKKVHWTSSRLPVEPIHWEVFDSREQAVKREKNLKTGFGRKWIKRGYAAGGLAGASPACASRAGKRQEGEEALVDGCRELALGDEGKALAFFRNAVHLADGAYLAGFLSLKQQQLDNAAEYLQAAADNHRALGRYFDKYGISAVMSLPITEHIAAHVGPDIRGVRLGLVEIYQRQKRWEEAIQTLQGLLRLEPDDPVIQLSLVELLLEARPNDKNTCRRIVHMLQDTENETEIHAALLYYKAKALRRLCLNEAARDTLTKAFRRKKDRSPELLTAIQYERALVYENLGKKKRARIELEKLYAASPDYEDVAERLGL